MFTKKLDRSKLLKLSILFVVVLAVLVTVVAITNVSLAPSGHQIAAAPDLSTCATGPAYGSSPANSNSSRLSTPRCPPLAKPLASWGS